MTERDDHDKFLHSWLLHSYLCFFTFIAESHDILIWTIRHDSKYEQEQEILYTHSFTHGAETYLRSCHQLCSYSRTSQHFMEPVGSLPCSQEPSTVSYLEPDQSNLYHPILTL
jgi:hypothetical protein